MRRKTLRKKPNRPSKPRRLTEKHHVSTKQMKTSDGCKPFMKNIQKNCAIATKQSSGVKNAYTTCYKAAADGCECSYGTDPSIKVDCKRNFKDRVKLFTLMSQDAVRIKQD